MPEKSRMSKAFAATFAVLTISIIGGLVALTILYKSQIDSLNPTPPPTPPSTTTGPPPERRLPTSLLPKSYHVFLQPHFYTRTIKEVNATAPNQTLLLTGNSTVHFHCLQATRSIYLHSSDLNVSKPRVMNEDSNAVIGVSHTEQQDVSAFFILHLEEALQAGGNYSLFLAFERQISGNPEAVYISAYSEGDSEHEDDANTQRFLVATHLEPTNNRMLFPCFDEPQMKAEFHVTIIHRRATSAVGNAAVLVSNIIDDEWKYTRFYSTPRMSTYLFAFTVSEFTSVRSPHERVEIKTYARPEATEKGHTKYAANITGRILMFFEKHFGLDYTMRKLDQMALPEMESAGMENWGLITYDEGFLLFEEGVSSLLLKEEIAMTVAHELAHQWFGNLVTMKWWSDLWLKEGFATYYSFFGVDHVEPTFKITDSFVMEALSLAFEADALASSHPLSSLPEDVQTNDDIGDLYDPITYNKGATVLRMLADFVGEDVFNTGIKNYLRAFQGENTDQYDLWEYIQKAVGISAIPIAELMHSWVNQIGYPVITVNTSSGEIYQKHFLFNSTAESSLWWHTPIRFMSNTSDSSLVLLDVRGPVMKEEFISKSGEWILVNVNCTGYYRVNYNPENWERLLTQLERDPGRIPPMNRVQLIDDAFNLARAKLANVTLALNLTRFLSEERAYLPWGSAASNLDYFFFMFDRSEVYGPMQTYLRHQVKGLYNFFKNETDGWSVPRDHASQHGQITAISVACSNGLPECIEMARSKFAHWMRSNSTNNIHPNLRSEIYCHAVAAGGQEEWEFAWSQYQSSRDTSERDQLQYALSCTKKVWLLNRYLDYTLDPEKIRPMDVAPVICDVAMNAAGQALAWNFMRAHWGHMRRGDEAMLIMTVTHRFSTQFELDELERFARDYNVSSVKQAIEQTQVNIQWVRENKDVVLRWFQQETEAVARKQSNGV